eukprot:CAMPEP_0183309424 /NCGR_PEP_ID=MMETSP0160_2-20130417/25336_1 /TAXON_ID=2839 ORGANISM="Odontella Sinensis, Strain Grunow 1884" /NCGR_SAMPLE_ID=MMETSP0160_2 /ASSEMBLY_ACC=CAM_ASM_000250 /LENGTH=310 /DNA_ID=CAMNT_0025473451 /DNA_START=27 /DNA_END=956 /DNA_ORIENTATION=-
MASFLSEQGRVRAQTSPFRSDCLGGDRPKIALITGGGSGICFQIVRQLLLHGCAGAVICGRRESFLSRASSSLSSETGKTCLRFACDVRNVSSCEDAIRFTLERFGSIDILVNGAAGNFLAEASALSPKGFKTVMEIDAQGTFNMCRAAHGALSADGGGVIINISATLQYGATWYQCHASAAKSAVDSLTRSLALEWGPDGVRVCGIAPGPIADTPGTTKLAPGLDGEAVDDIVAEGVPLGRMGTAFDIAMAAVYLCSEGAGSYVTGDVLVVDGGHWLYKPPMVPREMVSELSRKVEAKSRNQAPKIVSK